MPDNKSSEIFEILNGKAMSAFSGEISLPLGYDANGELFIKDLAEVSHALICGATGSGKTSFLQSLFSLVDAKDPAEKVRLMIFGSKPADYGMFKRDPQLYVPVFSDTKRGVGALMWAKVEILKRFRQFSDVGAKDIVSFNRKSKEPFPRIVFIIDDIYELLSPQAISEECVTMLQWVLVNGRQAGFHCLLVTSSVTNKALKRDLLPNIPCRICFAVTSADESKTVLGQAEAKDLGFPGEMIYKDFCAIKKLQALSFPDDDLYNLRNSIEQAEPVRIGPIDIYPPVKPVHDDAPLSDDEKNKLLSAAVEAVLEAGSCSVSMIQRRVKIGYSLSARIVDQLELLGIVGPYNGAKPRDVLVDRAGWKEIAEKNGIKL